MMMAPLGAASLLIKLLLVCEVQLTEHRLLQVFPDCRRAALGSASSPFHLTLRKLLSNGFKVEALVALKTLLHEAVCSCKPTLCLCVSLPASWHGSW